MKAIEAAIQMGDTITSYRRAGTGMQVLLLSDGAQGGDPDDGLFRILAEHFKVFAPAMTATGDVAQAAVAASAWLRDLVDGLGLDRPSVVADGAFVVPALGFALTDADRVDRLVVVYRDRPDEGLHEAALADTLESSGRPFLLLRLAVGPFPGPVPAVLAAALIRFLANGTGSG